MTETNKSEQKLEVTATAHIRSSSQSSQRSMPPDETQLATSPTGRFIKFDKIIGDGSFKTVFQGFDTELLIAVAWCELKDRHISGDDRKRFSEEAHMLKKLDHPNIVKYLDYFELQSGPLVNIRTTTSLQPNIADDNTKYIIITELLVSGTLKSYLKRLRTIKEKVLKNWCKQILSGLLYLHTRTPPIIHRDLKCDNIFINGADASLKLGDLGLATNKYTEYAHSVIGTPEFMAPEMYEECYDESVDVYAFGMCLIEMITGEYPYNECSNAAQIYRKVTSAHAPDGVKNIANDELKRIVLKCIAHDKNDRYKVKELLLLEYFKIDDTAHDQIPGNTDIVFSFSLIDGAPAQNNNDVFRDNRVPGDCAIIRLTITSNAHDPTIKEESVIEFKYHLLTDSFQTALNDLVDYKILSLSMFPRIYNEFEKFMVSVGFVNHQTHQNNNQISKIPTNTTVVDKNDSAQNQNNLNNISQQNSKNLGDPGKSCPKSKRLVKVNTTYGESCSENQEKNIITNSNEKINDKNSINNNEDLINLQNEQISEHAQNNKILPENQLENNSNENIKEIYNDMKNDNTKITEPKPENKNFVILYIKSINNYIIECGMESTNSKLTFKFSTLEDSADDIARKLTKNRLLSKTFFNNFNKCLNLVINIVNNDDLVTKREEMLTHGFCFKIYADNEERETQEIGAHRKPEESCITFPEKTVKTQKIDLSQFSLDLNLEEVGATVITTNNLAQFKNSSNNSLSQSLAASLSSPLNSRLNINLFSNINSNINDNLISNDNIDFNDVNLSPQLVSSLTSPLDFNKSSKLNSNIDNLEINSNINNPTLNSSIDNCALTCTANNDLISSNPPLNNDLVSNDKTINSALKNNLDNNIISAIDDLVLNNNVKYDINSNLNKDLISNKDIISNLNSALNDNLISNTNNQHIISNVNLNINSNLNLALNDIIPSVNNSIPTSNIDFNIISNLIPDLNSDLHPNLTNINSSVNSDLNTQNLINEIFNDNLTENSTDIFNDKPNKDILDNLVEKPIENIDFNLDYNLNDKLNSNDFSALDNNLLQNTAPSSNLTCLTHSSLVSSNVQSSVVNIPHNTSIVEQLKNSVKDLKLDIFIKENHSVEELDSVFIDLLRFYDRVSFFNKLLPGNRESKSFKDEFEHLIDKNISDFVSLRKAQDLELLKLADSFNERPKNTEYFSLPARVSSLHGSGADLRISSLDDITFEELTKKSMEELKKMSVKVPTQEVVIEQKLTLDQLKKAQIKASGANTPNPTSQTFFNNGAFPYVPVSSIPVTHVQTNSVPAGSLPSQSSVAQTSSKPETPEDKNTGSLHKLNNG